MSFTANANGPRGFDPVQAGDGFPPRMYNARILDAYASGLYTGQPIHLETDGYAEVLADDNEAVAGVFAGCEYVQDDGSIVFSPYWPAAQSIKTGTIAKCKLYYPTGRFLIHSNAAMDFSDVGDYFALTTTVGTGGSTLTGRSSAQLDASTQAQGGSGLLVQCVAVSPREEAGVDAGTLAVVQFANPLFGSTTLGT